MTVLTQTMTVRERWLAALDMKPVDRLLFWPKLGGNYQTMRRGKFAKMNNTDFHSYIGSDNHNHIPGCHREVRPNSSGGNRKIDDSTRQVVYRVGDKELESTLSHDPASASWHPMTFPVKSKEDITTMAAWYRDARVEVNEDNLVKGRERIAAAPDDAVWVDGIGESPLMMFVEHLAGVENAHFFLLDARDEVEDLFDAMHQNLLRKAEVAADKSIADATYLVENTSTTLISPAQYKRYCFPHITAYGSVIEGAGKRVILHMCGHLKGLLEQLNQLPVHAFEAFTSPTLGNTSLLDGRTGCPNTCLIGGTNAMLWLKPANEIIAKIEADLDELPHHRGIAVTSAGVMPPFATPDTIKAVGDWVKTYPLRV